MKKVARRMLYVILVLLALVVLGWIFTDQLMPSAYGAQGLSLIHI